MRRAEANWTFTPLILFVAVAAGLSMLCGPVRGEELPDGTRAHLMFFTRASCAPCVAAKAVLLRPEVAEAARTRRISLEIISLDSPDERQAKIIAQRSVTITPTYIVVDNKNRARRFVGAMSAAQLLNFLGMP